MCLHKKFAKTAMLKFALKKKLKKLPQFNLIDEYLNDVSLFI